MFFELNTEIFIDEVMLGILQNMNNSTVWSEAEEKSGTADEKIISELIILFTLDDNCMCMFFS